METSSEENKILTPEMILSNPSVNRRAWLKTLGISGSAMFSLGALRMEKAEAKGSDGVSGPVYIEKYPTSPLIMEPFKDPLPVPAPLPPLSSGELYNRWSVMPSKAQQDCIGNAHCVWPTTLRLPTPLVYDIKLCVGQHTFTSSKVMPIDAAGNRVTPPAGAPVTVDANGLTTLPPSTIYGFNGTFPGPMIYARYGQPTCVRFTNCLADANGLDRGTFGDPECRFLTHLHNGHTAPESDGNPYYLEQGGYHPNATGGAGQWCDNLYLNYPAGGDDREKQSFLWFHDHTHGFTGANVYKGMVGLYPIYDPLKDPGDERLGYRLPGVPKMKGATSTRIDYDQRIDYDIPLALYDCCFDDGLTPHKDMHRGAGETHPEHWGTTFYKHFPNHGFVGDVFTVNGTAFPVLEVKRRRYRLRFLGASVARCYELKLMSSRGGPVPSKQTGRTGTGLQGQYQLPDGQQSMVFTQIASEGGLLPYPIVRDKFEIWPANRKEVIVDFSKYMDGTPTTKGDVIYLVNTMKMVDGRKPNNARFTKDDAGNVVAEAAFDPTYAVPIMKIVIGDNPPTPDQSIDPLDYKAKVNGKATLRPGALVMRPLVPLPTNFTGVPVRTFELQRSGVYGGEIEWLINGHAFDHSDPNGTFPQAMTVQNRPELWILRNGGGGWTHPMHMHQEEHRVISRNGVPTGHAKANPRYVDDIGRADVVNLDPSEEVMVYRNFRTFKGRYVSHCHNLAHEDHSMFFSWEIT